MFRKTTVLASALLLSVAVGLVAWGSSHREAPRIARDPTADTTDVYAFESPDDANSVTLVANYIPDESSYGGPNFFNFAPGVHYDINIDNDGDARPDVTYRFNFRSEFTIPGTFLYNVGPITSLDDPDWNYRQFYTLTRIPEQGRPQVIGRNLEVPPVYVGNNTFPAAGNNDSQEAYEAVARQAIQELNGGVKSFAGQRDDPFFVDLRVFDLLQPVPLEGCTAVPGGCFDSLEEKNVHTLTIQVPKSDLRGPNDDVIGVWSTASRQVIDVSQVAGTDGQAPRKERQVSRLGNPLVNEVVIPITPLRTGGQFTVKDQFNRSKPVNDAQFLPYVQNSHLASLFNAIFGLDVPENPRGDLVTIFLTGIPGINQPMNVRPSEMLRFNMGAATGFPNGRTLTDDVVDVSLQAVAGVFACPNEDGDGVVACLEGSPFSVAPNNALSDGVDASDRAPTGTFPYLASPHSGNDATP